MTKSSTSAAIPVKGGEVLTVIYDRMQGMSGDPTARKVYGTLMNAAGAPYVEMLREWATTGRLHDPYEELCLKESKFISKGILEVDYTDEYWERRYTVSSECQPDQHQLIPELATRWIDMVIQATTYRSSTTQNPRWATTRWCMYTPDA